jgi:hypothetical protein
MALRFPTVVLLTMLVVAGSVRFIRTAEKPGTPPNAASGGRIPVLIELFTSEGCSTCPPADALLQKLDQSQPVRGAELIVLSEHVDYWNHLGWMDPYSSHEYSERQSAYAGHFGLDTVYTPEMVVDGHFEFVGSDERRAVRAIRDAAKGIKTPVSVSFGPTDGKSITVHVKAGPLPAAIGAHSAAIFLAIADNSDESQVSRGENAGRVLRHVAVLRALSRIGTVDASGAFSRDLKVDLNPKNPGNLRVVVIIQEAHVGRVLGAGFARLPG